MLHLLVAVLPYLPAVLGAYACWVIGVSIREALPAIRVILQQDVRP